jgi:hypothetical protein
MRILPAITTTRGADWKARLKEAKSMGLKEVCFFLTCLDLEQRKEFYELVKNAGIKEVPFAHIRNDMELWEIDYLVENYNTKVFNIHCNLEYPLIKDYSKYKNIIYIENTHNLVAEKDLAKFAGMCLDFAHLEDDRLMDEEKFKGNLNLLEKYPIGCNHISAVSAEKYLDQYGSYCYSKHHFDSLPEFNYLAKYPKEYFSDFIALELENTLEEQLEAREYILGILSKIC